MSKKLSLEDVLAGVSPIVSARPDFVYPQQGGDAHGEDERCQCVEVLVDDDDLDRETAEEYYDYSDCLWHFDDDNTCRYVKPDGEAACVVGEYFVGLGFQDLYMWEKRPPSAILDSRGYEVTDRANRFLNVIQQHQDQGFSWTEAYDHAIHEANQEVQDV